MVCSMGLLFSAGNRVYNKPVNLELGFLLGSLLFLYCYKIYQGEEREYLQCQRAKVTGHFNYSEHVFRVIFYKKLAVAPDRSFFESETQRSSNLATDQLVVLG